MPSQMDDTMALRLGDVSPGSMNHLWRPGPLHSFRRFFHADVDDGGLAGPVEKVGTEAEAEEEEKSQEKK